MKMDEYQKENKRFPGPVVGWLEQGAATPLSAVMRSVVDGPLMVLSAPPFSPVSGARARGIEPERSLNEASPCSGRLIE